MSQVLQLLLWIFMVGQLLQGIRLFGTAAEIWEELFTEDYEMAVCGRYQAMAANLRDAVTTWRKLGCGAADEEGVDSEVEDLLERWRNRYVNLDSAACGGKGPLHISLHRERNPDLDRDYPNWVVHYHE